MESRLQEPAGNCRPYLAEFHRLQDTGRLTEERLPAIQIIQGGVALQGDDLPPPGLNGVCTYKREDGTLICQEAFSSGTVDGYARYFDTRGELVGEDRLR
jgi:hypothetical protein